VQVDDFDISSSKVGETAVRQIDRAVEEARRLDHGQLSNEHLFLAFLQVEWDLFADVMHDVGLNPHVILEATEEQLRRVPPLYMPRFRVSPSTKLILKLALNRAMRAGKQALEAVDIVTAVLEETPPGAAASILSRHGANLSDVVFHLQERTREIEMRDERLKKRFELPAYLKQFSTNLNVLAQQDRLAPVFGREK